MLDAHQLKVFLTAAETLNFTHAAKRMHMTQPSISQHINSLEKTFGLPLFVRKGRQLELTGAGLALVPLAREMTQLSSHIEETMESLKGEVSGHLLVSCSTTPGKYVLPRLLAQFHDKYPQVRATCEVTGQDLAMQMLQQGQVHISLCSAEQVSPEVQKEAEFHDFFYDYISLVVRHDHPWAQRESIEPHELYQEKYIMREANSGTYHLVYEKLRSLEIDPGKLNVLLTLGNSEAIAIAVQNGLGVGFVSNIILAYLTPKEVVPIRVRGLEMKRLIYIGRQTKRPATLAQSAFWEFLQTYQVRQFEIPAGQLPAVKHI